MTPQATMRARSAQSVAFRFFTWGTFLDEGYCSRTSQGKGQKAEGRRQKCSAHAVGLLYDSRLDSSRDATVTTETRRAQRGKAATKRRKQHLTTETLRTRRKAVFRRVFHGLEVIERPVFSVLSVSLW